MTVNIRRLALSLAALAALLAWAGVLPVPGHHGDEAAPTERRALNQAMERAFDVDTEGGLTSLRRLRETP